MTLLEQDLLGPNCLFTVVPAEREANNEQLAKDVDSEPLSETGFETDSECLREA